MKADHEGFEHDAVGRTLAQCHGIFRIERDGLFAQHVLAGLGGGDGHGHVQMIGQGIVDGVDIGIGEEFLVGTIGLGDAEGAGGLGLAQIARGDGDDFGMGRFLNAGRDLGHADIGGRENAPADLAWCS